jgi:hypothetical protein
VILLSLGHDLDGDELAETLGVSRNHAHALVSRARSQLERSLGALIVARTGRDACPGLDTMLAGWDGQLTALMRKRLTRHIDGCEICGDRKRRELTPALFAGLTPLAALAPGFREQLLRIMADRSPAGLAHRISVGNRAGTFGPAGFPKPISPPSAAPWRQVLHHPQAGQHAHAVVAGAAAVVAAAGVVAAVVIGGAHHGPSSAAAPGSTHAASGGTGPSSARGGPGASGQGPGASTSPVAFRSPAGPGGTTAAGASSRASVPAPGTPGTSSATSPASSSSPATSSSSSAQGTLAVSTGRLELVTVNGLASGTFTLTAQGGPVDYSVSAGSALAGSLSVSPASGSLTAGSTATITVTSRSLVALDGQLTVSPGGHTVTVVLSIGL